MVEVVVVVVEVERIYLAFINCLTVKVASQTDQSRRPCASASNHVHSPDGFATPRLMTLTSTFLPPFRKGQALPLKVLTMMMMMTRKNKHCQLLVLLAKSPHRCRNLTIVLIFGKPVHFPYLTFCHWWWWTKKNERKNSLENTTGESCGWLHLYKLIVKSGKGGKRLK